LARRLRIEFNNAFYHVMTRGNTRSRIFKKEHDKFKFLYYLDKISKKHKLIIHAYCLMNNHYHLLIETPKANLSKAMHNLNTAYTTYYNISNERIGHLFAGRYKAILVDKDNYAMILSSYIHLNPIRAGFVKKAEDYFWSSYKFYINNIDSPRFLEIKFLLGLFGNVEKDIVKTKLDYKQYVENQIESKYDPKKEIIANTVLGSRKFIKYIRENAEKNGWINNKNTPDYKRFFKTKSIKVNNKKMKIQENLLTKNIFENVELYKNEKRKVLIYLFRKYTDMTLTEIGKEFGILGSSVSLNYKRFCQTLEFDEEIAEKLKNIVKKLFKMSK